MTRKYYREFVIGSPHIPPFSGHLVSNRQYRDKCYYLYMYKIYSISNPSIRCIFPPKLKQNHPVVWCQIFLTFSFCHFKVPNRVFPSHPCTRFLHGQLKEFTGSFFGHGYKNVYQTRAKSSPA